jgi:sulfoxide reductase heme-binding subunit YedZ
MAHRAFPALRFGQSMLQDPKSDCRGGARGQSRLHRKEWINDLAVSPFQCCAGFRVRAMTAVRLIDWINGLVRKVPTWAVYIVCLIPVPVLVYWGVTGGLGREPISKLEHELGALALKFLIAGLCITPLRRFAGLNLIRFRRSLGVLAFTYVTLHLLVWAVLDVQSLDRVWADILKRPYITIGMAAFILMIPLAVTSNNRSVRALGAVWRKLHLLTYPVAILAAVHFVWLSKGFQLEPLAYLAVILGLLALRVPMLRKKAAA